MTDSNSFDGFSPLAAMAPGNVSFPYPQRQLAHEAALTDAAALGEEDLALVWGELVRGAVKVVNCFFTEERFGLVLAKTAPRNEPPLAGRRLRVVTSVLCGVPQNNVAIELGLAPSTVAMEARLGLQALGVLERPRHAHPLLMLIATAAERGIVVVGARSFVNEGAEPRRVISVARPERRWLRMLPEAELTVLRLLVEGQTYAEMAQRRGTSQRTIANQTAAVFRRLQVSGRGELIQRLFTLDGLPSAPVAGPPSVARPSVARALPLRVGSAAEQYAMT